MERGCLLSKMNSWTPKQRRPVEVCANVAVLAVVCLRSIQRCTVGNVGRARRESRPTTVSTPDALTPDGYLQLENGTLFADHSTEFSNRLGVSQVTKLSVLPRSELFFQSEPLAVSRSEGQHSVHEGEVFAGAPGVLFSGAGSQPTVSVSFGQLYSADSRKCRAGAR